MPLPFPMTVIIKRGRLVQQFHPLLVAKISLVFQRNGAVEGDLFHLFRDISYTKYFTLGEPDIAVHWPKPGNMLEAHHRSTMSGLVLPVGIGIPSQHINTVGSYFVLKVYLGCQTSDCGINHKPGINRIRTRS